MHHNKRKDETLEDGGRPSKTQVKQAMHELQALGEDLVQLSRDQLKRMNLDEDLLEAVREYQRIPKFEAQRRQLQYIGKLMRGLDPEPIRAALAHIRGDSAAEVAKLHRLERLRTRFLEDEAVLQEIAEKFPQADLTRLRQLRRAAVKEQAENKPPRNFRELFRVFKELDGQETPAAEGVTGDE
ncbi:MAG: ribosome biogenesis factor YjgA [Azovibrio sp.]|uniref:ribosome biogenesis factor YjgA n=1 Tax=Azovibrio sp. TaxID=1872673 RepID=UPI003C78D20C